MGSEDELTHPPRLWSRIPRPTLMLVTDSARLRGRHLGDVVVAAVEGGVNLVQLRHKGATTSQLTTEALELKHAIDGRAELLINGDIDAVLASDADGLHLPEDAPYGVARERVGERCLISRATHGDGAQLQRAEFDDDIDLLVLGTAFATPSKPGVSPLGPAGVGNVLEGVIMTPVIAIGGVTIKNLRAIAIPGLAGVAVIGAIFDAADPRVAAAELRAALEESFAKWYSTT